MKKNRPIKTKALLVSFFLLYSIVLVAQNQGWDLPDDAREKKSPFEYTEKTTEEGEQLYNTNCKSCHGDPGKGNYMNLQPAPGDPAEEAFQEQTDGEMYYKITNGKTPMPAFKNGLTPEERWKIIGFIRSFNENYQQEVAKTEEKKGDQKLVEKDRIDFSLDYSDEKETITATVLDVSGEKSMPIVGAEVALYVKRYFGNISVGETQTTNNSGRVTFKPEKPFPQDVNDSIKYILQLTNEELYQGAKKEFLLQAGKDIQRKSLRAQRAMWNTAWRAPAWLIVTYLAAVIFVWSIIIYVLLELRKLKKIGDQKKE